MTDVAPFHGQTYFYAEPQEAGKTRVYFFTIKQSVYDLFSSQSLVIIPETLLALRYLQKKKESASVEAQRHNTRILSSIQKDKFVSLMLKPNNEHINQVVQHSLVNFSEREVLDEPHYLSVLSKQLFGLPLYVYLQSFNTASVKKRVSELPLKVLGLTSAAIVSGYFIFVSAWLYLQNNAVEENLALQQKALNDVFTLQASIDKEKELLSQLADNKKASIVTTHVWPVLLELIRTNAEILSINYFDNQYTVRVKSIRSTDVVQFLSDNKETSSPEVTSAVVKSRGKEIITVKFSMVEKNALNKKGEYVRAGNLRGRTVNDTI